MQLTLEPGLVVSQEHIAECLGRNTVAGELVLKSVLLGARLLNNAPLAGVELYVAGSIGSCC